MNRHILMLIGCAIFWSLGGLFIKYIQLPALTIAGVRAIIACTFIAIFFRKTDWKTDKVHILGSIAYCAVVTSFVLATKLTTAGAAILLQYSAPIYVALFGGLILGEKCRKAEWISIFIVFVGMTLFFKEDLSGTKLTGNLVGIFSGVAFAWMILLMRKAKNGSPISVVVIGNILTAIICIPWIIPHTYEIAQNALPLAALGIFQLAIPYILYALAIEKVEAVKATLIITIEPILNPIWVFLFLGETLGMWSIIGGTLVVVALLWEKIYLVGMKSLRASGH